jgi:hypothetical protein
MNAAEELAAGIARDVAALPSAAAFLSDVPALAATRFPPPRRLPVCDHLPRLPALASPATISLVRALVDRADALEWRQTYSAADFGAAFLSGYGWTEVIGLRGPIPSERLACGFLLLGPDIEYPAHAHEAEELYLPLAGEALWMRGDARWVSRAVGEPILHPSWMPHATRTRDEPMLALYLWRGGDLAAKSKILR